MVDRARHKTWVKSLAKLACAAALVAGLLISQQASAAEDPYHPGLPAQTGTGWLNGLFRISTINEALRAKQWFRIPTLTITADTDTAQPDFGNDPYDPVHGCNQPLYIEGQIIFSKAYVHSPEGAPEPYGYFPPVTVRTVAFGAIPVEATVQISQLRDAENLPVPLLSEGAIDTYWAHAGAKGGQSCGADYQGREGYLNHDATTTGKVNVRVSDLSIDGVRLDIGPHCGTVEPAEISMIGKGYWSKDPDPVGPLPPAADTPYYAVPTGGLLDGTIDIPAFTGCLVGTEDVSPLLTTSVSGPGNPTTARLYTTATRPVPAPFPIPTRPAS